MKNLFALILILNLNLYTMDYIRKINNHNCRKDYAKIVNISKKEFYDIVNNTTLNDLRRNAQRRKHAEECDCFPYLDRFLSRTKDYLNQ